MLAKGLMVDPLTHRNPRKVQNRLKDRDPLKVGPLRDRNPRKGLGRDREIKKIAIADRAEAKPTI